MPGSNILGSCNGPFDDPSFSSITAVASVVTNSNGLTPCDSNSVTNTLSASASWTKADFGASLEDREFSVLQYCCGGCNEFSLETSVGSGAEPHGTNTISVSSPSETPPCGPSSTDEYDAWITPGIGVEINDEGECIYTVFASVVTTGLANGLSVFSGDLAKSELIDTHVLSDSGPLTGAGGGTYSITITVTIA